MMAQDYSDYSPQYYGQDIPNLLRTCLTTPYTSLLDAGCGDGALLHALYKEGFCNEKHIYAIDISPKSIELVQRISPDITTNVDDVEVMATIADASIDIVISSMVIEHADDARMLRAMHRVLRRGGIVYLETVYKKWYGWYFRRNNGKWVMDTTHLREYTHDIELTHLIIENNYRIQESTKTLIWFPIIDTILRSMRVHERELFTKNPLLQVIRRISLPIFGYYRWELVLEKIA